MFLSKVEKENKHLLNTIFSLHQEGKLLPDSYVIDVDTLLDNAKKMVDKANEDGIRLYFMLKQIGRNPYVAKELVKIGFSGAVVVDFKEAQVMMRHNVPIGNIGHLVQIPEGMIEKVIAYQPEVITVYSIEKIESIAKAARKQDRVQPILLRVVGEQDLIYSGQTAGFPIKKLEEVIETVSAIEGVEIEGVTSFPCYLFDEAERKIKGTNNLQTVIEAVNILKDHGINPKIVNTPSATCLETLDLMVQDGGNCAEPGHGLTGTTPAHEIYDMEERICIAYLSEVSHNFKHNAYCFGGGHYRRSHMQNAIVGRTYETAHKVQVIPPDLEAIDYHMCLSQNENVGDAVIMSFRCQVFVTRSDVVLVRGVQNNQPEIIGIYDSLGNEKLE